MSPRPSGAPDMHLVDADVFHGQIERPVAFPVEIIARRKRQTGSVLGPRVGEAQSTCGRSTRGKGREVSGEVPMADLREGRANWGQGGGLALLPSS